MSECKSEILIYNIPLKVFTRWRKVLLCKKKSSLNDSNTLLHHSYSLSQSIVKTFILPLNNNNKKLKQTNHNKMKESFLDSMSVNYYVIYLFPYLQISHKYIMHAEFPHPFLYPQGLDFFVICFPEMFPTLFHQ